MVTIGEPRRGKKRKNEKGVSVRENAREELRRAHKPPLGFQKKRHFGKGRAYLKPEMKGSWEEEAQHAKE